MESLLCSLPPKSGLKQGCFANAGWKSPLLQDPTVCFGDVSPSTSVMLLDKIIPALWGGELKLSRGSRRLQARCEPLQDNRMLPEPKDLLKCIKVR